MHWLFINSILIIIIVSFNNNAIMNHGYYGTPLWVLFSDLAYIPKRYARSSSEYINISEYLSGLRVVLN